MAVGAAIGVGALVALVVAGLAASSSSSGSSSAGTGTGGPSGGGGGGGGGTGTGGLDLVTCAQAFDMIPNDPKDPATGKGLKDVVLAAVASPTLTTAQAATIAAGLRKLALAAPDAKTNNALNVAATCVEEHAKEVASGSAGAGKTLPDAMSCDAAFGSLSPDLQAQIMAARTAGAAVAKTFADTLDATAALTSDPSTKTALQVAAKCLRAGGGSATGEPGLFKDESGNYSRAGGLPPRKGVASNPLFQWKHAVVAGDNASLITARYFGSGATRARVDELINNNPTESNGRNLGPIRSDWAPGTPGQTPGVLNWTTLIAGDLLRIPKSWNAWIDETAVTKNDPTPWPTVP